MQPHGQRTGGQKAKEKRDVSIMNTNNSCIVSKRSVEKIYHKEDNGFLRHFVKKFQRRSPLINRGYWLRMRIVERTIRRFLEDASTKQNIVVNLGCGYDTIAFKFIAREPELCQNVKFVDVDYAQLLLKKSQVIRATTALHELIKELNFTEEEAGVLLDSQQYQAVACDLQDVKALQVLRQILEGDDKRLLFIAEVSTAYMNVAAADDLLKWAVSFPHAQYLSLEQYLPDGADNPFAKTMLDHFKKLQSPLKTVVKYSSFWDQHARFSDAGWQTTSTRSLWQMWTDDEVVPPSEKRHLDSIEPFDEWEEFCLFASHYFVLLATNASPDFSIRNLSALGRGIPAPRNPPEEEKIQLSNSTTCDAKDKGFRRYGASYVHFQNTTLHHGGQGAQGRLSNADMILYGESARVNDRMTPIHEAMCHTITTLDSVSHLMVGGRKSPDRALRACYSSSFISWRPTWNLPLGRYRHCALACGSGVLVIGGKHDSVTVAKDWSYFNRLSGWSNVTVEDSTAPMPRFGACTISHSDKDYPGLIGLILGGMDADGHVLEDMWGISNVETDEGKEPLIRCTQISHRYTRQPIDRFGAKLVKTSAGLLLMGGITGAGILRSEDEVLKLEIDRNLSVEATRVNVMYQSTPRAMLIGHQVEVIDDGRTVLILGGGAVCFSFGTFWNPRVTLFNLHRGLQVTTSQWLSGSGQTHQLGQRASKAISPHPSQSKNETLPGPVGTRQIPVLILGGDPQMFEQVVDRREPAVFKNLEIGRCVQQWEDVYLKEVVGADTEVVIHASSSSNMNFVEKNFSYSKKRFGDFMDDIGQGKKDYLRAIATRDPTSRPTRLVEDFPGLASDFCLPSELAFVLDHEHSSPLRISGPVAMWLHYDVMSNVLCQIRGSKRLVLYAPGDANKLGYRAGASSSELTPFDKDGADTLALRRVQAHEALLKPGDVLFIPAFWSHTAAPTEGTSVAVNVFFRDLEHGYAAGKDVYGNRDLQAYENGRRDVQRILKSFKDLPRPAADFYLQRLAAELEEAAKRTGV